ncbi:MAG: hypothetical protein J7K40_10020 [candidate division Zixibacteria bacterium]|nr:hypothetical protein [candidate division Zixibacteria bacterium]
MEFWPKFESSATNPSYQSYFDEYIPVYNNLVSEQTLSDFTIEELSDLRQILLKIDKLQPNASGYKWIDQKLRLVSFKLASTLFYVGDIENAIPVCCMLGGIDESITPPYDNILAGLEAYDSLRVLAEFYKATQPLLATVLQDIYQRWEAQRACVNDDKTLCLFVEKNHEGKAARGSLKALSGIVELREINDETDTVAFDNQVKTPDDPFIGVAYDSLKAVREILKKTGFNSKSARSYRAHFSIENSQQTFTGDSIGLAMGLIAYTQLIKTEITRQDRFIANEIALTSSIDSEGNLLPVNMESLKLKVERAFYSAVKYLVVPEECYLDSKKHIDKLSETYPRRKLQLIAHSHLVDIIDDLNVLRSEKVCMSQYITKKVVKYTRAAKIQIPILLALLYFIICLIFPKAWVGFDWNPEYLQATESGFEVMNSDSVSLWSKKYNYEINTEKSKFEIGDLNKDGKNEIGFLPQTLNPSDVNVNLFVYNHTGDLMFRRHCVILGEYPGDISLELAYYSTYLSFAEIEGNNYIISKIGRSYPAREHIKLWNTEGEMLGWYVNAGYCGSRLVQGCVTVNDDVLLFLNTNNRMKQACIFALPIDSCCGVSPPYTDPDLDLENVKRGNQLAYVLFPRSDVNRFSRLSYNIVSRLMLELENVIRVDIIESKNPDAMLSYYIDEKFRVISINRSDNFVATRNALVAEGKLPLVDWSTYLNDLQNRVTYWTDSGWVTEAELRASEKK